MKTRISIYVEPEDLEAFHATLELRDHAAQDVIRTLINNYVKMYKTGSKRAALRERQRSYKAQNRDKVNAYQREWRRKNKERVREYNRQYSKKAYGI